MRKPDFFMVGAPKCGTTAMYSYLSQHPQVFMPAHKEPHFFGSDLDFRDQSRLSEQAYLALFAPAGPDQKLGEASVFYLRSERAAQEIKSFNPSARIIIMLRNPVDMIHSFHSQRFYNGTEDIADFATALEAEGDRREGRRLPRHLGLVQGLFYRELGHFADQVQRYLDAFEREQIHVILYEDLSADTAAVFRATCTFLGIDPGFEPEFELVNPNKVPRSRRLRSLLWKPPPLARRVARAVLPSAMARQRLGRRVRRLNTREEPRPPLATELRDRLEAEFAPRVERLGAMLGRDLRSWSGS